MNELTISEALKLYPTLKKSTLYLWCHTPQRKLAHWDARIGRWLIDPKRLAHLIAHPPQRGAPKRKEQ